MLGDIRDEHARAVVARVLDEFERRATPVWPRLRAQVVHTDLTVDNTLTDDDGLITGIIDFGDMSHTALITDLASVLDSVAGGREGDELFRAARLVVDGYQRRVPLEDEELAVLDVAWAARSAITIAISSWRVAQGLEDQAFAERYNARRAADARDDGAPVDEGWARERRARPDAGRAPRGRVRTGDRPALLRRADRGRERAGRVDHRHRRPHLPRRLQQRPVRRPRAPAGDRRDRAPEPRASTPTRATCTRTRSSSPSG